MKLLLQEILLMDILRSRKRWVQTFQARGQVAGDRAGMNNKAKSQKRICPRPFSSTEQGVKVNKDSGRC